MSKFLVFAIVIFFLFVPTAFAVWSPGTPLVPECTLVADAAPGNPYCSVCDLIKLAENLISFAIYLAGIVIVLLFVYAGFLYVTAASGGEENIKKAKKIFTNGFIGFIVIISAWLIVDLILDVFISPSANFNPLGGYQCESIDRTTKGVDPSALESSRSFNCPRCESVSDSFQCKAGIDCKVTPELNTKLSDLSFYLGSDKDKYHITEAGQPTAVHKASCHYNATCIDFNHKNPPADIDALYKDIQTVVVDAQSAGLRAVYETNNQAAYNALRSQYTGTLNVVYEPQITAPHFSIYCDDCSTSP